MQRALTPPVFLPTRACRSRQRSDLCVVPHVGLIVARPCSGPMSLPSQSTRMASDRSWSAGFSARGYLPLLALVDTHTAALWRKSHGKRPRGSVFPLSAVFKRRLTRAARRVSPLGNQRYFYACMHLRVEARPSPCIGGRRLVPPAIATSGPQTGRERPRLWTRTCSWPRPAGSLTSV